MYNLNKKQKLAIVIILAIITVGIFYYLYAKDKNENAQIDNNLEIKNEEQSNKEKILVHVSGAVKKEGIVELDIDSRISDAIDKAGGIREDAYIEDINLAYKLEDGMKIKIPTIQEHENEKKLTNSENISNTNDLTENYITKSNGLTENNEKNIKNNSSVKVNLNTATQEQLESLPGIGSITATRIINYRKENGSFKSIEDIKEVSRYWRK